MSWKEKVNSKYSKALMILKRRQNICYPSCNKKEKKKQNKTNGLILVTIKYLAKLLRMFQTRVCSTFQPSGHLWLICKFYAQKSQKSRITGVRLHSKNYTLLERGSGRCPFSNVTIEKNKITLYFSDSVS